MSRLRTIWATVVRPDHLRRTTLITLVVGSWLSVFNLGDILWQGHWSATIALKLCLNYLTPFVVANLGLLSRSRE